MAKPPPPKAPAPAALTPEQAAAAKSKNAALEKDLPADDWNEVMQQIKNSCGTNAIQDGVVKACKKISRTNCAGPTPDKKQRMSSQAADDINKAKSTSVDFNKLAEYEGGQATKGYVPWWPKDVQVTDGVVSVNAGKVTEGGSQVLQGSSQSGVTIGTGVDLGQQKPDEYKKRLKDAGISQTLIDKLSPYMGLKRAAACKYLRNHPLEITKDEADALDKEMKSHHLKDLMTEYDRATKTVKDGKAFTDLSEEEQTVLASRHYQDGSISKGNNMQLARDMAGGDTQSALDRLSTTNYRSDSHATRIPAEHTYLQTAYGKTP